MRDWATKANVQNFDTKSDLRLSMLSKKQQGVGDQISVAAEGDLGGPTNYIQSE